MPQKHPSRSHHCKDCSSLAKGIFCGLDNTDLDEVSQHKVNNHFKKGQTLFVQGNPPFGLYCVSTGNIKLSKTGPDGKESLIKIATKGDVLGHRSLFTEEYYSATATAIEDSQVCFLDKKYIMKAIAEKPTISANLISKLSRDMGAAENKAASLHQKNVRERLAELLLLLKESHGEKEDENKVRLNIKLTREEMASMIGTANETLIRFMSEFKDEGLIEEKGKIIFILNEEKLVDWASLSY